MERTSWNGTEKSGTSQSPFCFSGNFGQLDQLSVIRMLVKERLNCRGVDSLRVHDLSETR